METFRHRNITGKIVLDTRREKKDKVYPVKYRITFQRKQVYYSSGYNLTEDEWKRLPDTKNRNLLETRIFIYDGFRIIEGHIKELMDNFSFDALKKRMKKGSSEDVHQAFNRRVEYLKSKDQIGTSDWYKYAGRSLKEFSPCLKFSEITPEWLQRYEKWFLQNRYSFTTIAMYMKALKVIVNEAKSLGHITTNQYPFAHGKYKIPTGEGRNMALSLAQIGKIVNYKCVTEIEEKCRDLWFFSYLCNGINMVDLLKLKYSDIQNGEISFYRQKTITKTKRKRKIVAPLLSQMEQIIAKWGNKEKSPDTFIFPFMKHGLSPLQEQRIVKSVTKLVNNNIKKIGNNLGVGNISTYTARHSFATVLKRSGANIAFISESLGHTDIETTENYLASFEPEERIKNANLLTNF